MTVARWIFLVAGLLGILLVVPLLVMEDVFYARVAVGMRHPEFLYGFAAVTLAWQAAFLFIGLDPLRLRPMMIPAMLEKFFFAIAVFWLYIIGRVDGMLFAAGCFDFVLGILFVLAWFMTPDVEGTQPTYESQ
jgi:hypothetical protein